MRTWTPSTSSPMRRTWSTSALCVLSGSSPYFLIFSFEYINECTISNRYLTENLLNKHKSMMHKIVLEAKAKCTKCEKILSGSKMRVHMQTHGEKLHECKLCYTKFTLNGYLKQHYSRTHKDDQELLKREITDEELQYNCLELNCEKKFATQKILDWHKTYVHIQAKVNCNFCTKEFSSTLMLRKHCKKAHTRKTNETTFHCKLCYKRFGKRANMVAHKYVHKEDRAAFERKLNDSELIFECKNVQCDKKFISESVLKYHTNDHHRELEFKFLKNQTGKDQTCPLCFIKFKSFYTMHSHILEVHKDDKDLLNLLRAGESMGDPQFGCSACDEKFVRSSILEYHQNRVHRLHLKVVQSQKENKCKLCYKVFHTFKHLRSHMKIHKKDKSAFGREICESDLKFECKEADCGKKFISENILKYHSRSVHREGVFLEFRHLKKQGENAHHCPLCHIKFKSFYNMHRHILERHTEEKALLKSEGGLPDPRYNCSNCDKSFVTRSLLKFHTERTHKKKSIESSNSGSWACNHCTEIFTSCNLVQAHSLTEHKKKYQCLDPNLLKFECDLCRNKFMKQKYLKKHQENVHKEDREFLLIGITDDDLIHQCTLCPVKFVSETSLTLHKERIHRRMRRVKAKLNKKKNGKMARKKDRLPNNISPDYKCDVCDQEFDVHAMLRRHSIKVHKKRTPVLPNLEKRFKCKLCYHQFDFKCYVDQHQKGVHKEELHHMDSSFAESDLKFDCENCEKKFISQNSKDFHRRYQHKDEYRKLASVKSDAGENKLTEKGSYSCILCYNKFNYNGDLKRHVGKFHRTQEEITELQYGSVDESKLLFNCNSCEKKFLNGTILIYHQRYTHRAAKSSQGGGGTFCKLCYVRFQKSKNLNNHKAKVHKDEMAGFSIKLEENELKYSCDQCSRKFWTENILRHHIGTRHKVLLSKNTLCNLCQVDFKLADYQRKHVQKVHKTKDELEAIDKGIDAVFDIPCEYCDKRVYSHRTLGIHKNRVHSTDLPRDLTCRLCQVKFKDIYKQRAHVGNVHKSQEEMNAIREGANVVLATPCNHCGEQLFSSKTLDYHMRSLHREEMNKLSQGTYCKLCYIRFEKPKSLSQHKTKVHMDEMEGFNVKLEESALRYSCDQCKRKFWTENILENHTRTRHIVPLSKETYCRLCQVDFSCAKGQRVHIRNVHKSKEEIEAIREGADVLLNVNCPHCQRYVYSNKCLKLHTISSHKSNLPKDKTCRLCQVEFKSVFSQRVHIGNVHKTNGELEAIKQGGNIKMDITCKYCGKGVYSTRTLNYHILKLHNKASKVDQECEVCHKVFKWDYSIKTKMRQHMNKVHGRQPNARTADKNLLNFQYMYMMSVLNAKK